MSEASYFDDKFDNPTAAAVLDREPETETPISVEEETLLTRGYFTATVTLGDTQIVIRTLKLGEELEAAMVANKYSETIEAARALATATIAAAVVTVNGRPLVRNPLGPQEENLEARFNYITTNWYWLTVKTLHEEYNRLLNKAYDAYSQIKKD